jgi:hypothetical protein
MRPTLAWPMALTSLGVHRLLSSAFVPVNVLATIVIGRSEKAIDLATPASKLHRDSRVVLPEVVS